MYLENGRTTIPWPSLWILFHASLPLYAYWLDWKWFYQMQKHMNKFLITLYIQWIYCMQYTKLFEILVTLWWDTIIAFILLIFEANPEMYIEVKKQDLLDNSTNPITKRNYWKQYLLHRININVSDGIPATLINGCTIYKNDKRVRLLIYFPLI